MSTTLSRAALRRKIRPGLAVDGRYYIMRGEDIMLWRFYEAMRT